MTSNNFRYWLQGFFELNDPEVLSQAQVNMIKDHLAEVKTRDEFCSWLQGCLDADGNYGKLTVAICKKLEASFKKVTPSYAPKKVTPSYAPKFDLGGKLIC